MTPEIKAAIEKELDKKYIDYRTKPNCVPAERLAFKAGAEYGYKLAEQQIKDSERNYSEMFKTMTASVGGYKERLKIAIAALKEARNQTHCHDVIENALKELGEIDSEQDEWRSILRQDAENP